jgi:translation initiation factor 2 subunit 2
MNSFDEMLDDVYEKLESHTNSVKMQNKITLPPLELTKHGHHFIWKNIKAFLKIVNKPPEHVVKFFSDELKCQITWITESKSDGINIDYARLTSTTINELMKKYVLEYVFCKKCKSTNSIISKDSQVRKYLFVCQNCGDQYYH